MPKDVVPFMLTVLALAIVPGANNATITRQVLRRGRSAGLMTVAGTSTGILLWASAGALGVSSVLLAQPAAFEALRLTGAALLAGLGVLSLHASRTVRPCHQHARTGPARSGSPARPLASYGIGVLSSIGNPKAGVIAVALLPQFVTPTGPVTLSMLALGAIWATLSGTWFVGFVWLVDSVRDRLDTPTATARTQLATGLGLISLATATALLA